MTPHWVQPGGATRISRRPNKTTTRATENVAIILFLLEGCGHMQLRSNVFADRWPLVALALRSSEVCVEHLPIDSACALTMLWITPSDDSLAYGYA